jgi:hypothetical protein
MSPVMAIPQSDDPAVMAKLHEQALRELAHLYDSLETGRLELMYFTNIAADDPATGKPGKQRTYTIVMRPGSPGQLG